jgi:hypothetical protein
VIPPPAHAALAALALAEQAFGFTPADVQAVPQREQAEDGCR